MKSSIFISAVVFGLSASSASAQVCDMAVAEVKVLEAEQAGVILGLGSFNDVPTISVSREVWSMLNIDTRMGMIEAVECAVVGEGQILAKIQIASESGVVLAVFDGIERTIDISE